MTDVAEKRARFRALHETGCFVLPNPWDIGSARLFQHMGFAALASTSAGFAWTQGRPDYAVTRDMVLAHLMALCAATDLPVNADFENGFAEAPEDVAAHVRLAARTGIAGLSIEDTRGDGKGLYDVSTAVARIKAAKKAASEEGVLLVARTEHMLHDASAFAPALEKLKAFAEAGADVLFAPGVARPDQIEAMVKAVAPRPLNVLMFDYGQSVAQLGALGVRRISMGGALARVGWNAVRVAAEQLLAGSFQGLNTAGPSKSLNEIFRSFDKG
jgi:2-methylisocitrate lyase-like PEP mutase family enzyme